MGGMFKFDSNELLATLRIMGSFTSQHWMQFAIFIFVCSGLTVGIRFSLIETGEDTELIGAVTSFAVIIFSVPFMTAFHRTILAPLEFKGLFKSLRFSWPEITYAVLWAVCSLLLEFGKNKFIAFYYFPPIPETIATDIIAASVGIFAFAGGAVLSIGLPLLALDRKADWAWAVQSTRGRREILVLLWFVFGAMYEFVWFTVTSFLIDDSESGLHADAMVAVTSNVLAYLGAVFTIILTSAIAQRIYGSGIQTDI